MKKILLVVGSLFSLLFFSGCQSDATVASKNLSKAAEMFEINRRIIFYNSWTDKYMMTITGRCSIEDANKQLEVTCKLGKDKFKKHFLGLSGQVSYFAEQLESKDVSVYHYRVVFKPQTIIPEVDFRENGEDLLKDRH